MDATRHSRQSMTNQKHQLSDSYQCQRLDTFSHQDRHPRCNTAHSFRPHQEQFIIKS